MRCCSYIAAPLWIALRHANENYTTLYNVIYITIHYIEVIQKHVTVSVGRCAPFGELISKRIYGGGKEWECVRQYGLRNGGSQIYVTKWLYIN